jgi:hypothetical protein
VLARGDHIVLCLARLADMLLRRGCCTATLKRRCYWPVLRYWVRVPIGTLVVLTRSLRGFLLPEGNFLGYNREIFHVRTSFKVAGSILGEVTDSANLLDPSCDRH